MATSSAGRRRRAPPPASWSRSPKAPAGLAPDLAGPDQADLVDLARAFVRAREFDIEVLADDSANATTVGALLPAAAARIEGPTFQEWLAGEDAAALTI